MAGSGAENMFYVYNYPKLNSLEILPVSFADPEKNRLGAQIKYERKISGKSKNTFRKPGY